MGLLTGPDSLSPEPAGGRAPALNLTEEVLTVPLDELGKWKPGSCATQDDALREMRDGMTEEAAGWQGPEHENGDAVLIARLRALGENDLCDLWNELASGWWWS